MIGRMPRPSRKKKAEYHIDVVQKTVFMPPRGSSKKPYSPMAAKQSGTLDTALLSDRTDAREASANITNIDNGIALNPSKIVASNQVHDDLKERESRIF